MNTSEEVNLNQNGVPSYSRLTRTSGLTPKRQGAAISTKVPRRHKFFLLIISIIVGCLSVANPLLTDWANSLQSQNLYVGFMFTKGQLPFTDMFATGGFLYYTLIALAYYLGSTLWLVPLQVLIFYVSGIYFYKLIHYFTSNQRFAVGMSGVFYLLNVALGFGGLYPVQFAMPFVLVSLWFLTKYFAGLIKDEAFILYGFAGSASMLLDPRTLVFWLLSFIAIIVYNSRKKHLARGFYQLLCIIFGMILILYTVGYFVLNLQILSPYISQAIVYPFTYFATSDHNFFLTLLFQVDLLLFSGLLFGLLSFNKVLKDNKDRMVKYLIFVVFIGFLLLDLVSQTYDFYHLLAAMPFGLILTAVALDERYKRYMVRSSHRRQKSSRNTKGAFEFYVKTFLYLPVLVLIVGIGRPIVSNIITFGDNSQRSTIATYLASNTSDEDSIYVWDSSSKIYLESGLPSSSQFSSPLVNTAKDDNQKVLEDELLQNVATYVIVHKNEKLPEVVQKDLKSNYETVSVKKVSDFTIYRKK